MDEHGVRIPSQRELFKYVQELSLRLDRTEKELSKLKSTVGMKQKKEIITWLNQPNQLPTNTFEEWFKEIGVDESHVLCVGERDLTIGMQTCIQEFLAKCDRKRMPIRTFTQKTGVFYIYTRDQGQEEPRWRIMCNDKIDMMLLHLSQQLLREFLKWQKTQAARENESERDPDREILFMMKINGTRTSAEKRIQDIRKWLFPKIEENLRVVMECEYV
jgi:regulator of replication initiation timing